MESENFDDMVKEGVAGRTEEKIANKNILVY
jgi:hypothetical protein